MLPGRVGPPPAGEFLRWVFLTAGHELSFLDLSPLPSQTRPCSTKLQTLLIIGGARVMGRGKIVHCDIPMTRRELLATVPIALASGSVRATRAADRPRIAAIVTEYRKMSHAQGIVDRFLDGYGYEGEHYHPAVDIVSLYVDQRPPSDLPGTRSAASRFEDLSHDCRALTCGGDRLAVDGVLIIGEHGKYPRNDMGQTLYPRFEFFQQTVEVFRRSGKSVPVFNDKHLSWSWDHARSMVDLARELGFGFMAGSSLPVTWRLPAMDVAFGAELTEGLCVGYGGIDSYDFTAGNAPVSGRTAQGGETGVRSVTALRGESVWQALSSGSWDAGGCDPRLLEACLCRSFRLIRPGQASATPIPNCQLPALAPDPVLYPDRIRRRPEGDDADALGHCARFYRRGPGQGPVAPLSTQMYLPAFTRANAAELFQPAVEPHRNPVQDGHSGVPRRTDPADNRAAGRVCRLAAWRSTKNRHAPFTGRALSGSSGIDLLAELTPMTPSQSKSQPAPPAPRTDGPRKRMAIVTTVWRLPFPRPAHG